MFIEESQVLEERYPDLEWEEDFSIYKTCNLGCLGKSDSC